MGQPVRVTRTKRCIEVITTTLTHSNGKSEPVRNAHCDTATRAKTTYRRSSIDNLCHSILLETCFSQALPIAVPIQQIQHLPLPALSIRFSGFSEATGKSG